MPAGFRVICLLAACLPATEVVAEEWVQRSPQGAWGAAVERAGPRLLLGTSQGLYASSDAGDSWSRIDSLPGQSAQSVTGIAVNPRDAEHWYVQVSETVPYLLDGYYDVAYLPRLRETRDGGLSWRVPPFVREMNWMPAFHPGADKLITNARDPYFWQYSPDRGLTWIQYTEHQFASFRAVGLDLPGSPFGAMHLSSLDYQTRQFRLSSANGSSWGPPLAELRLANTRSGLIFPRPAVAGQAFWLLNTLTQSEAGSIDFVTGALVRFPQRTGIAGTLLDDAASGGLLMSTQQYDLSLPYTQRTFLSALAPAASTWTDRGWVEHSIKDGDGDNYFPALLAEGGTRFWFSDNAVGLRRSDDAGATWQVRNAGLQAAPINAVLLDPRDPDRLLAGRDLQTLQHSSDGGLHWQEVAGEVPVDVRALARSPVDPDHQLATARDGLYRSRDAGASWQRVSTGLAAAEVQGWNQIVWCANDDTSLLATVQHDLYRSLDGGANWSLVPRELYGRSYGLQTARQAPQRVYVATATTVYRSDDCGASLVTLALPAQSTPIIAVHPQDSSRVAIRTSQGDWHVAVSTDAGASWSVIALPALEVPSRTAPLGWFDACHPEHFTTSAFREIFGPVRALRPLAPRLAQGRTMARSADSHCVDGRSITAVATNHGLWVHRLTEQTLFADSFETP